ncbi:MAG: NeuD/PglB/VioB family sugar acetyltransferase [Clostridiales bacterium]|jgi:sugar O-acyltransferase (sialic acid O-acetyltransferase NeuD family)|nr:NeuD/PglB/VioB family sugar acetyltransferase [Eubacteriales bacterium]MDH7567676.1 NeuD/PglB/VioB family sugar acetyltransferase [Clostridiales bacterium]
MEDIILYGSGGMARQVAELIEDINAVEPRWNILGCIDDIKGNGKEASNGYKILGTGEILKDLGGKTSVVLAMSDPAAKENIYERIKQYNLKFPVLIHPSARVARNAVVGEGSIIGIDCIVSSNVNIGRHVFLNIRTVVGHDAVISDFCSCLVNCIIAGSVWIKEGSLLGSNCVIMEKKVIGRRAKIGMGSIVSFDVEDHNIVLSRPSKAMYFGE